MFGKRPFFNFTLLYLMIFFTFLCFQLCFVFDPIQCHLIYDIVKVSMRVFFCEVQYQFSGQKNCAIERF